MQRARAEDLRDELNELRERHPKLKDDDLFILWFLLAFITEDEDAAINALTGGSNDKGVDAVFIDDQVKTAFVLQGKYHKAISGTAEKRSDLMAFAALGESLCAPPKAFEEFCVGLKADVEAKLDAVRQRVLKSRYQLQLHYITTGRVSPGLQDEAKRAARGAAHRTSLQVTDGEGVLRLFTDFLAGLSHFRNG